MKWQGDEVRAARAHMAVQPMPWTCGQCGEPIEPTQPWVVGHIEPIALNPARMLDISNWQHEHRICSDRSGNAVKAQKAAMAKNGAVFPNGMASQTPHPLVIPSPASTSDEFVPMNMTWDYFVASAPTWLEDILEVPEDASPPLAMTGVHKESVGTYGPVAEKAIEDVFGKTLRWWQRLCLYRQLEHKADGSLSWRVVIQSAPRRSGKSVFLGSLVMWRLTQADLFGEEQQVVHTAMNMRITKEIQRQWWRWAENNNWTVRKANGSEEIETPEGDRWLLLPQSGITGYSPGFGVVDECWDVEPLTISENLEPALMDRMSSQMLLTSTAHTRATSLMRNKISESLGKYPDPDTLLLLWGARPTDNIHDRAVWRAASPYQTSDRDKLMERRYLSALNGESDPEFDNMNPMDGFKAQYLNIWPLGDKHVTKGQALVTEEDWAALEVKMPSAPPHAVAVESSFAGGYSVAQGWPSGVRVDQVPDAKAADALIKSSGFTGIVMVGTSLRHEPVFSMRRIDPLAMPQAAAVQEFGRLLGENAVHWIESDLSEQALSTRIEATATGIRLVSRDRTDGIKAAVWVINKLRNKRDPGQSFYMPG